MNQSKNERIQRSESFAVGALLALTGGCLDAYTYLCRGGVFANAQTGNLVLLALHLARWEWRTAGHYIIPICAFAVGVLVAEMVKNHHRDGGRLHWRHTVLILEIAVLAAVSFIPQGGWDTAVNVLVSFVCALQVETFRKVRGYPFASTMCTGNLRSGTEALYHGLRKRDGMLLQKSGCYYGIIAFFLLGAALGGVLSNHFPQRTLLLPAAVQLAVFFLMLEQRDPGGRE